ncbi:hypothetical protein GQ457_05G014980 [Hibiscus cannabinus]
MFIESFKVESPNVKYKNNEIQSVYNYETTELVHENRNGTYQWVVKPKTVKYEFKTDTHVPKLGVILVGWGGNNGSTLTGGTIANKEVISWATKDKVEQATYFGSLTQASTIRVGSYNGEEIYAPFKSLLPMVKPEDIVFGGWDISDMNLADAMARAKTANTGRYNNVIVGLNDTLESLLASLEKNESEISPSTLYAIACVLENVPFINGSPQNTFVPGLIDLAIQRKCLIGGDDFKSGQTKMKSILVDFLVGTGIKEISKSNVVDDMVSRNGILYEPGEHHDHVVVIKYVPYVGDSKRDMDEYTSEIFMGGKNTIVLHNTCEDSLLVAPIILDLVLLAELSTRIQFMAEGEGKFNSFHHVATILSYLTKAPLLNHVMHEEIIASKKDDCWQKQVPPGTPVVNALSKQRAMLENILRACIGLASENNMILEYK